MPEFTRRQLLLWAAIGLAIVVIGGKYLLEARSPADGGIHEVIAATVSSTRQQAGTIKVHVVGAVARPGLYELKQGARVDEVIDIAGGPVSTADLSRVNLAAKVADGQQLVVPDIDNNEKGSVPAAQQQADDPINLNSATLDELTELDGIGPKTAQKIIDYREEHGGFSHVEELLEVSGIGPAKFDQIKDSVVV